MKQTLTIPVRACDVEGCGRVDQTTGRSCIRCKKDFCGEHAADNGVLYKGRAADDADRSADGFYCHGCNSFCLQVMPDPLHGAYRLLYTLIEEWNTYAKRFNERTSLMEETILQRRKEYSQP